MGMVTLYDMDRLWTLTRAQPTNWFQWVGLRVRDGKPIALAQSDIEMGRTAGKVYEVKIPEAILAQCRVDAKLC